MSSTPASTTTGDDAARHVLVVRAEGGTGAASGPTDAALLAQSWPAWSVVRVPDTAETGLALLPDAWQVPDGVSPTAVVVLRDGDVLEPTALERAVGAMTDGVDLVSWDSVEVDGSPRVRPGWSPDLLLSTDYLAGAVAVRPSLLETARTRLGDLGVDAPWCMWTALLAVDLPMDRAVELPEPLATQDRVEVSDDLAARVVTVGLRARGWPARASVVELDSGARRVELEWAPEAWPTVTVIIPTRHNTALLEPCLTSLRTTQGPAFDVLIVDNGGRSSEHEAWYDRDFGFPVTVRWWDEQPFNYSRVNNVAVSESTGDVVVLLNDDTEVSDPRWLAELVGLATRSGIGCVGMQLIDGRGLIQHNGVWLGLGGFAGHLFAGLEPGADSMFGSTTWYRNTLAVTGACLAVRRDVWLEVGGLDESLVLCGSDVVLGLDVHRIGLRNVCSPLAGVLHLESATRSGAPVGDQVRSLELYRPWHDAGDPYLSPRLSLRGNRPHLRPDDEPSPIVETPLWRPVGVR